MGKTRPFLAKLHFETKKVGKIFCVINEIQRLRACKGALLEPIVPIDGLKAWERGGNFSPEKMRNLGIPLALKKWIASFISGTYLPHCMKRW